MVYRLAQLDIPDDDPFKYDALERRPLVEFLVGLIDSTGGPFVLALDSPWGTGKTTLVRMLEAELKRQNYSCIHFNAWQVDYVTDPLVALVSSIDRVELGLEEKAESSFRAHMKTVRRVTSLVAKRAAVAAAKALTAGALDLESEIEDAVTEFAGDSVDDIVESFQKECDLLDKFRAELEAAIKQLPDAGKKPTLVFFVDEIDRCRPTFAVELLERIKHLFDVANILFVLSLDKQQLEASITAVYGQDIKAAEYLRRFIDLEYAIPAAKTKRFVESLFSRFHLDEIFERRTHPELRYDRSNFIDFFSSLAGAIPLSLRAQERCMTRLRVVLDQTPDDNYLEPVLVALLIVLRSSDQSLFIKLCQGDVATNEIMAYLEGLPGGQKIVFGRMGIAIEANLIASDENEDRRELATKRLGAKAEDATASEDQRNRSAAVLRFVQGMQRSMRGELPLSYVTRKIDLVAGIQG
jgi:KAP family P-loop domain